jgi:serine protease Do/serine protease DegQ
MKAGEIFNSRVTGAILFVALLGVLVAWWQLPSRDTFNAAVPSSSSLALGFDNAPLDRSNRERIASYADVLDKVLPAVVSVYTTINVPGRGVLDFGVGSGSILSADGYILTNHHVIAGPRNRVVDGIHVKLPDGREFDAQLVGSDEKTDIALIKVATTGLPTIHLADSDKLKVGDVVFAVGNPMDVGFTVTHGIVSATGRSNLGLLGDGQEGTYENFIQTDASINPGNSGGPLVDAQGRQVGMDAAILSTPRSGGSIGIGFAIPSSLLRQVIHDLMQYGEVRRGFLGVGIQDLDHDLAQALGLSSTHGALISQVDPELPAGAAGIQRGDVVVRMNDQEVDSADKLRYLVASNEPGAAVELTVLREGQPRVIKVQLAARDGAPPSLASAPPSRVVAPKLPELLPGALGGVALEPISSLLRTKFRLPKSLNGLVVTRVDDASPYVDQLSPGMVIVEVNAHPVTHPQEVAALMKSAPTSVFYIFGDGRFGYIPITPISAK